MNRPPPIGSDPKRSRLSEETVRALAPPAAGNRVHYFGGEKLQGKVAPKGFGVRITAGGSRAFVLNYRLAGRERRYTIGEWKDSGHGGAWSVLAAIDEAIRLRREVDKGVDPQRAKEEARATETGESTVSGVLDDFVKRHVRNKDAPLRSADQIEDAFERLVKPVIGKVSIYELKRSKIVALLDNIEDENGPVMADRVLAYVRKCFNWYAARDDRFNSPIVRGLARTKPKERARRRVLDDQEIRDLWAALQAMTHPPCYAAFVRTLLLTAQRRSEVARLRWDEIGQDEREEPTWIIGPQNYKTKIEHAVPLTDGALDQIGQRPTPRQDNDGTTIKPGPYAFSTTSGNKPFSGYSKAKRELDEKIAKIRTEAGRDPMSPWVLHDLRRTARTLMSRAGVAPDIAERVLGHVIPGVQGTYDRYAYAAEKRDALEKLAALVDRILNPRVDNVTEIPRRRAAQVGGAS